MPLERWSFCLKLSGGMEVGLARGWLCLGVCSRACNAALDFESATLDVTGGATDAGAGMTEVGAQWDERLARLARRTSTTAG